MKVGFSPDQPIYRQIYQWIEDRIVEGAYAEETQIPSTVEMSVALKMNIATVMKGYAMGVDAGLLYKKRGMGVFIQKGAIARIREQRRAQYWEHTLPRIVQEAQTLGIQKADILAQIEREWHAHEPVHTPSEK